MTAIVPFLTWIGDWRGEGQTASGGALVAQATIEPVLFEAALRVGFHTVHKTVHKGSATHSLIAAVGPSSDGRLRAAAFSTALGNLVLEQTPDDDGVLALAGQTLDGHRVSIALVREDDELMQFALRWGDGNGFTAELRRVVPA